MNFLKKPVVVFSLLLVSCLPGNADQRIIGKWHAILEVGGLPQPVFLTVAHTNPGENQGFQLKFSQPRNCGFGGQYGGFLKGKHHYYVNSNTCNNYSRAVATFAFTKSGSLLLSILKNKKPVETMILKKQP